MVNNLQVMVRMKVNELPWSR